MTGLRKNAYATVTDLRSDEVQKLLSAMETYQMEFLDATNALWKPGFPFTGDSLYAWSRQWEYPYCATNLDIKQGRILDAGSGITFFPFYLGELGFEVSCCDTLAMLGPTYAAACTATRQTVKFTCASIARLTYPSDSFDAVACISVLEHLPHTERQAAVGEFLRVLKPGGRLVITCDISLERDSDIVIEEFAVLVGTLHHAFEAVYPADFRRPVDLLTTNEFADRAAWRLPWRAAPATALNRMKRKGGRRPFHSIAVIGMTFRKPAPQS